MTNSATLEIQKDSVILVHITMKLSDGSAADSTKVNNKPAKIIMGDNSISPAFEAELIGMSVGTLKEFTLSPKDLLVRQTLIIFITWILINFLLRLQQK
jgi:FKBP-type peptidyl-prolyl cis-trans isomerase SlpA